MLAEITGAPECSVLNRRGRVNTISPLVTQYRGLARERFCDRHRLVKRQIADLRSSAGVSLPRRVDAQCGQTESAIEGRLMDFDGLDLVDRHDARRTPRPSASRAKITIAQRIAQVPIIRGADEIDERQQRKGPQG